MDPPMRTLGESNLMATAGKLGQEMAEGETVILAKTPRKSPLCSFALRCGRTPLIVQTPVVALAGTSCGLQVPRCQFNATSSLSAPGMRYRTSKYVSSVKLCPEKAAVNEPPG